MIPFLKEVAEDLHRRFGRRMEELCLVFPNRRAGLFFNKYLGESLDQPVWSPAIYTIQDLMARLSDLEYADDLELISLLFKVYLEIRGGEESFDEFIFWGEVMLNDFDEVDKYLVNAGDLFRNLADLKEIEGSFDYLTPRQLEHIRQFWSTFGNGRSSEQKQQFLQVWNLLNPVYERLREMLLGMGAGYEGMIYRNVAERIPLAGLSGLSFSSFVFIGFNALNPCEQKLFRHLQESDRASFYWDYDEHYLGNEMHEAGRFIREDLSVFRDSGARFKRESLAEGEKNVRVYSIPSDAGQAQLVHQILEKAAETRIPGEETAIVLADEELLIPVLNALPDNLDEINVTMGYPVIATPVFSLIEHLINMQGNLRKGEGGSSGFYCRNVLPVLQHQYIRFQHRLDAEDLVREIHEKNLIYVSQDSLARNRLFEQVFRRIEEPGDIADYLLAVLELITGWGEDPEDKQQVPAMELEFIYRIYTRIKRLKDVFGRLELNYSLPTFLRLFHRFLQRTRIPFSGEPLAGIQVMGVLETRVLDFDRIIVLSMNEGAFPRTVGTQSFIPHNLRLGFGLPTLEYRDAIYAYYFYRLIQRPGEIHLIYNNKSEGLNSGEKSRYIYQLRYSPAFRIREWSAGFDVQSTTAGPIRVEKTEPVMKRLMEYCRGNGEAGYLSPSALNIFIDCPLQFYFNYVAGIREPLELKEEVDPALFGTLLHESVRTVYGSLENPVQAQDLKNILSNPGDVYRSIDDAFREVLFGSADLEPGGRNRIIREIIYSYARRILEKDAEYCPIRIHALEQRRTMQLRVRSGGQNLGVSIGGKIDRIDQLDRAYRVLDYKTGSGSMYFPSVAALFETERKNRNRAAFQTFLYAKLFASAGNARDLPVTPGVYLVREIYNPGFRYHFGIGTAKKNTPIWDYSELDHEFTETLERILGRLFDPSEAFVQTGQEETCRNCPYRGICQR